MILRVDPEALAETARPLRDVAGVAREVEGVRGELVTRRGALGSQPVSRAVESFLEVWADGLRAVGDRAESLATALDAAVAGYAEAEERTRRRAMAGMDGGQA